MTRLLAIVAIAFALLTSPALARAGDRFITVASTTSTQNSGLFEHLLPRFTAETGIEVRVVAVGTGQAIRLGESGDADVLIVHHEPSEQKFVADGFGVARHDLMYNDFVLIGPDADPAEVAGGGDVVVALAAIARARSPFLSRGDDSGTHQKELALWREADVDVGEASGGWYREAGAGMGATLNSASAMSAYTLSDRATWLAFGNKGNLRILVEGDPRLFNQYGIIRVDPKRHPHVKAEDGRRFVEWMLSPAGQKAIAEFAVEGQQAFFPNAD